MVRRPALSALFLALGCSSQSAAPPKETDMQLPQQPQQTAPATATANAGQSGAAMPTQGAKMDAAMPMQTTPPAMQPQGTAGAAMRAPDAAVPPTQMMQPMQMQPMQMQPMQMMPATDTGCTARKVEGPTGVFFHHVHFNTTDPSADLAFYEKYFNAKSVDFCTKQAGAPTKASQTERGYFLYTKVATPPDPTLNAYLEHIGWCHPDPVMELQRQAMLGAPLWKSDPGRGQCETAAAGTRPCNDYWFYLQAPSGAKVEIAMGPGPATMGFGHVHVIMGEDLTWYEKVSGGKYKDTAIDMVNITDVLEDEMYLSGQMVTDTRGKPIDHIAFSTTNLTAERDRIKAAGIEIAEDISLKPEYGFKSFFVKSAKGIWLEMVEDSPFAP